MGQLLGGLRGVEAPSDSLNAASRTDSSCDQATVAVVNRQGSLVSSEQLWHRGVV